MFDINKFKNTSLQPNNQYLQHIRYLENTNLQTSCIEQAVNSATENLKQHQTRSFVIYGEPQSGKTEMMIALTARLLDQGHKMIIHLLNDNVSLLDQNLKRFKSSGLAPAPVNFKEIIDRSVALDGRRFVIFCKKNQNDLNKLIDKLGKKNEIIIIDDEADYASPNSKINKGKKSKINELILSLLGEKGIYIGVTATPARLDLNNTFENDHEKWISFPPHNNYTGQETFFPLIDALNYQLTPISNKSDDSPRHCREAFFRFLVNSAYLNLHPDINDHQNNYTFLIHTSGKKVDHKKDFQVIQKIFPILLNQAHSNFEKYVKWIWEFAKERCPGEQDQITEFIIKNISRNEIKILNSDQDVLNKGTAPACPFTVIIGGNIISRGVTFENLLGMFFTRDVKHKLQQDTYIQRARMFGARGKYLKFFELTIPKELYEAWQKCFVFHRLALSSIAAGKGAPIWLSDSRVAAVSPNSIDKSNVTLDSGEMSYAPFFDYFQREEEIKKILNSNKIELIKIKELQVLLGEDALPSYLIEFIETHLKDTNACIFIHQPHSIAGMKDADQNAISRKKGFMGGANFSKDSNIAHHLRIHYNSNGKARFSYKYVAGIVFLKNLKRQKLEGDLSA